jgi:AcrR family transcriptional regulator
MEHTLPRVIKAYEERKAEMVAAAWSLFSENGYDQTTVNAIIEKLGVSKGTFYHYFTSKEDILNGVVETMTREGLEAVRPVFEDETLPAIDKLNQFIKAARAWRLANIDAIKGIVHVLYRDENIIIRHKLHTYSVALIVPLLTELIEQGVEEGVFNNAYPSECAELLLHLGNTIGETNARLFLELESHPDNLEQIMRYIDIYCDMLERLLGAPRGSIEPIDKNIVQKIVAAQPK